MARILVIDDERVMRESVSAMLRSRGYETLLASDGSVGLEVARTALPDLILCDLKMDLVNGFELLSAIRNEPSTATIPFILMTAHANKATSRYGMELGADDFLAKPFTTAELVAAIRARLERQRGVVEEGRARLQALRAQMSSSLPHELRTPLNAILGFADLLRKNSGTLNADEIGRMSERIYMNGKRLQRLVENYLIYAQIGLQDGAPFQFELFRSSAVHSVAGLLEDIGRQKGREFNRESDLTFHLAQLGAAISPQYLTKIVDEIIDNAFRFSSSGNSVIVTLSADGPLTRIVVKDGGRGMTSQQISSIGAFVQFDRARFEQQGSGLGLTVARRLTEVHGGTLSIDSTPGNGTIVTVLLPKEYGDTDRSS